MNEEIELIQSVTVTKYKKRIKTSDAQRRKYYRKRKKKRGKGKGKKLIWKPRNPLPKKYAERLEEGEWSINKNGYLLDEDGNKVLANPRSAGKPNYEPLSGNRFSSGMHHHLRNTLVEGLKDHYRSFVQEMEPFESFPLMAEWEFHTKIEEPNFDMSNFWFYYKYFEDTMVDEGILPDDSVLYISKPAAPLLIPVDTWEERKFVFHFFLDKRETIIQNELWKTNDE